MKTIALPITLTGNDPENDPLTFSISTEPANGYLSGTFPDVTYLPNGDFNGPDSFTFVANDGTSISNPGTISITVNPVNDPPTADDDSVSTVEDTPLGITLTGNDVDGDEITFSVVDIPASGTLSGTEPNLVYTPGSRFHWRRQLHFHDQRWCA